MDLDEKKLLSKELSKMLSDQAGKDLNNLDNEIGDLEDDQYLIAMMDMIDKGNGEILNTPGVTADQVINHLKTNSMKKEDQEDN